MAYDVIVVGNGVIGISAAWTLAKLGAGNVAVVDRRSAAAGSSGLGAGSVTVQRFTPTDVDLCVRSQQLLAEVEKRTNGLFRFHRVGRLTLVDGAKHEAHLRELAGWLAERGIKYELMSGEEASRRYAGLDAAGVSLVLATPGDGWVRPPELTWAITLLARDVGVDVLEGVEIARLATRADRVAGVVARSGHTIEAARVVLATNMWTRELLAQSGVRIPQKAYRTQVAWVAVPRDAEQPVVLDEVLGIYTVPRNRGEMLVGFGRADIVGTDAVEQPVDEELMGRAVGAYRRRWRTVGEAAVLGSWAGMCDITPDDNPYLGNLRTLRGVTVACGFGGYGIMRGPAGGEVAAHLALGMEPSIEVSYLAPERFAGMEDFRAEAHRPWSAPFGVVVRD